MGLENLKSGVKKKAPKRKGRGPATGNGCTAGRGNKGQKSRSGGGVRLGFEGGQMPLYRRIPKRGFKNPFKKVYQIINVSDLNKIEGDEIKLAGYKVLGEGELTKKVTVTAEKFTESAKKKIIDAGGKYEELSGEAEPTAKPKTPAEEPAEPATAEEPTKEDTKEDSANKAE